MAHFEFVGKDHIGRGCHCPLEECSLDCSLRREFVNKPTNADRIRGMSDEDLSIWLAESTGCGEWCLHNQSGACAEKRENECCINVWYKWLKSPVEVDNGT